MLPERGLLASFADPAAAAQAVRALKAAGYGRIEAAMPAPYPELVEAIGKRRSRIGLVTFVGALLGLACGIALTVGTSLDWPLVTGGKPIVSVPPFVIIIFEVTVLIGSLTNLAAVSLGSRLGAHRAVFSGDARFTSDRIGVFVGAEDGRAEQILREGGAEEVSRVG